MHLQSLKLRLANEQARYFSAKTKHERDIRAVHIAQINREIQAECAYLGIKDEVTDDDYTLLLDLMQ